MIIIDDILDINPMLSYAGTFEKDKVLFFDIETTGFAALSSQLYLIGCIYYENNNWKMRQWFVDDHNEEKECLREFSDFLKNFTTLIHFNGNGFDIPYLTKKYDRYRLKQPFDNLISVDIYKRIMPYKKFLSLDSIKQKSIEKFLGINREDKFNGGELIYVYFDYQERRRKEALNLLLLHNKEDLIGTTNLLPILAYTNLKDADIKLMNIEKFTTETFDALNKNELYLEYEINYKFPVAVKSRISDNILIHLDNNKIKLLITILDCEMKYFYHNYKDYYYLTYEDTAIHKSVAQFVDKEYRTQAKACNCYARKIGNYIPITDTSIAEKYNIHCFRKDYASKELFCELTELINSKDKDKLLIAYLECIINKI